MATTPQRIAAGLHAESKRRTGANGVVAIAMLVHMHRDYRLDRRRAARAEGIAMKYRNHKGERTLFRRRINQPKREAYLASRQGVLTTLSKEADARPPEDETAAMRAEMRDNCASHHCSTLITTRKQHDHWKTI